MHIFSQLLRLLREIPRSRFLSFAGGMSLSWAVLRTLPGLGADQAVLEWAAAAGGLAYVEGKSGSAHPPRLLRGAPIKNSQRGRAS